jgi:methylmalonyl-CoA/ethylmalonyl-CoA epimerase
MALQIEEVDLNHHHAAFSVPDLEASILWYREKLGFEIEFRLRLPTVPADVAMLRRGGLRVELFQPENASLLPPGRRDVQDDLRTHGTKHVAYAVSDLSALLAELERRQVDIAMQRRTELGAVAFIRDNSGNLIEFIEQNGR